jgi:diketogulonate reductase-like aldo/keto reductase
MPVAPSVTMLDGTELPRLGLGTGGMDDAQARTLVTAALDLGYRLIDSATRYRNEAGVGAAVAASEVDRDEIVVTSKLPGAQHGYDEAIAGCRESLARLGLDRIDLYLIHWPLPRVDRYVDTWRAFIELRERGLVRSIGVSNFTPPQIERLVAETGVWPDVNQIELHPYFAQPELRAWHAERGIITQSWRPLGTRAELFARAEITGLAESHARTPAQIVLRWHLQHGAVPVPKSADPGRMADNLAVFDFELSPDELATLDALDSAGRLGGDPDTHEEF